MLFKIRWCKIAKYKKDLHGGGPFNAFPCLDGYYFL